MSSDQITVYRPNQRHELGLVQTWVLMSKNIYRSRELIWQLFKRDFFAVYKKSFLGITWIFIMPIFGIASWVFLQKAGLLKPGDVGIPYPAYVLIGTSMWGLFLGLYTAATQTLTSGKDLILQVNFPHEALLFKQTAQQIANFTIAFVFNIIVLLMFKVIPSWMTIFLPLVILPMFFLGAAIGLIVAMVNVVAIDLSKGITLVAGLLMYTTPIIYSKDVSNPIVQMVIKYNPLTHLVCSARDIVIYGRLYDTKGFFLSAAGAFVLFMISWRLFYVCEDKIIERIV